MKTIHAVFTGGVFRPTEPVDLPDPCEVEFEVRSVNPGAGRPSLDDVYAVLGKRFDSGERDVAARHDEHQP
jgi:predicted DNA-binding antitoxin AbrB/MazE fold protein